ncbi:hypothetical protein B0H11DRAFT_1932080 [Mycena galericulata]|nr:hypothetical protein B0H11DRAFT_1932080 [Mycena galericulata]
MSPLTSMEIIKKAAISNPTSMRLRSLFRNFSEFFTTTISKSKLVGLFDAEIKPKALQFKEERLKVVIASAEGIIDGHTGQPLKARSPKRRRSPGKSAVAGLSRKAGTAKPGKVKLTRELGQNVVEHDEQMEQVFETSGLERRRQYYNRQFCVDILVIQFKKVLRKWLVVARMLPRRSNCLDVRNGFHDQNEFIGFFRLKIEHRLVI